MDELERWLTSVGLDQLAPLLRANDIDHELLPELTEADLEKIGISLGHRKKLLKAAAHLKPAIAPSSPPASSPGATAASAERRHLTVMFYDLVNSTILATRHDPEDVREVLGAFHRRVGEAVARFTGFVTGMSCVGSRVVSSHRDRGTRSTEGGQVDRTMGCEPELVADHPCDPPGCAVSADP